MAGIRRHHVAHRVQEIRERHSGGWSGLVELLPQMGAIIAEAIGVDAAAVNVKASTGNLIGPEGMGRSVSASAVVMVVRAGVASAPRTEAEPGES